MALYRSQLPSRRVLYVQVGFSKEGKVLFRWCSRHLGSCFGFSQKEWTREAASATNELLACLNKKTPSSPSSHALASVQRHGRTLYEALVGRSLSLALKGVSDLHLHNETSIPLGLLFSGTHYLVERVRIQNHSGFVPLKRAGRSVVRRGMALVLPDGFDKNMEAEFDDILRLFKVKKGIELRFLRGAVSETELIDVFEASYWVHFIGHGSLEQGKFHFHLGGNKKLSVDALLRKQRRAPAGLVMSACQSLHSSLRRWFFEFGGRVLVGSRGELVSSEAAALFRSFYGQVSTRKGRVIESLHSVRRKSVRASNLSGFQVELFGDGFGRFPM